MAVLPDQEDFPIVKKGHHGRSTRVANDLAVFDCAVWQGHFLKNNIKYLAIVQIRDLVHFDGHKGSPLTVNYPIFEHYHSTCQTCNPRSFLVFLSHAGSTTLTYPANFHRT